MRTAFQRIHGVSPIRYLHLHRMGQARRALRDADRTSERVADIATRFGFANLGRFAVEFRQLFGVSPSQLLRGS
jgi:AraC family ethanolamine operon transcriptional activator